ncbi:hypothetical protein BDV09DRAFT_197332 [Aspergillus tetrazonus]
MFMNYMWGIETDEVAGIEATRYLESKGVPILTNPSPFLAKTKLDRQSAAADTHRNGNGTLRVPGNTPGRYPKIEVAARIALLKGDESLGSKFGVMVQDYIVGRECSVIVVEMGREVVALTPLRYVFPEDTPPNKEFLTWFNKFTAVDKGIIRYAFVEEQPAMADLQNAAVNAFKVLGVAGGGSRDMTFRGANVIGIDLSPSMTENPDVKKVYKEVRIGPMQELIMGAGEHDHIVCFGAFNFLPTESLVAVLARSFMLARKSFTFDVEDATVEFCQKTKERLGASSFNHVVAVEDFGIPKGWKRVLRERRHAYQSPSTGDYVDSYFIRFERV